MAQLTSSLQTNNLTVRFKLQFANISLCCSPHNWHECSISHDGIYLKMTSFLPFWLSILLFDFVFMSFSAHQLCLPTS